LAAALLDLLVMTPSTRNLEQNSLEATVAYSPNGAPGDDDLSPLRVARTAAAEAQANEAIRMLLRSRLRIASLIVTSFPVAGVCAVAVNLAFKHGPFRPMELQGLTIFAGPTMAFVALTTLLWSRWSLSLAQLRAMELALVGFLALLGGWKQHSRLGAIPDLIHRFGDSGVGILAGYHSLTWFALLAIYGLFIPNSWRRCALVVGLIAACPLAFALAETGRADWPLAGRPFLFYLAGLGVWTGFGAVLAVFGSHHIAILRQQASAMRELGQYRLKKRLGAGGMGEVYLAEHRLLRRPCAVKLIRPERLGDPSSRRRFEDEVQATAALTHPNTVEIYDYGHADDGTFYYVMEYLPGLSLADLVRRYGPLPPGRVVFLLRQVCEALREAHAVGLIHRDVKPGNIIACLRGGVQDVAKLLDFGLVQTGGGRSMGEDATLERGIAGTPAYLSPEQAAGQERLDARSDLYSLGAVAFFLLTAQPPFVRGNVLQVLAAHRSEPARFPTQSKEQLPTDLQVVVLRCLAKNPADRFADVESLEQALAACGCAGSWTRETAARWWQEQAADEAGSPKQALQM
jgi:serine/threonine-protein kinase